MLGGSQRRAECWHLFTQAGAAHATQPGPAAPSPRSQHRNRPSLHGKQGKKGTATGNRAAGTQGSQTPATSAESTPESRGSLQLKCVISLINANNLPSLSCFQNIILETEILLTLKMGGTPISETREYSCKMNFISQLWYASLLRIKIRGFAVEANK